MMAVLEKEYDCSCMCIIPDYYLFTDINKGKPNKTCRKSAETYIKRTKLEYKILPVLVLIVLLLHLALEIILFVRTKRWRRMSTAHSIITYSHITNNQ